MSTRVFRIVSVSLGAAGLGLLGARWWVHEQTKDMPRSKAHDEASALMQYLMYRFFKLHGTTVASVLEHDARHIARVQENLLLSLMRSHDSAELPKSFSIHLAINPETFRENVPLTRYPTYREAVDKTLAGAPGLLLSPRAPATMVACTAGTSGPPKWLPVSRNQQEFHSMYSTGLTYGALFGWLPETFSLRRACRIVFPGEAGASKAGIPTGVDSAISTAGCLRRAPAFTTPEAALSVPDAEALLYLHLLFALRDGETALLHAEYGPAVVGMLALLDDPATRARLIADVETGSVAPHLDIPVTVRVKLEEGIKPDRRRAADIRRALLAHDARGRRTAAFLLSRGEALPSAEDDAAEPRLRHKAPRVPEPPAWRPTGALATDLWPHLAAVVAGVSGPLAPSRDQLRRRYLPPAADVPILDPLLQSTEALLGGNLAPFDDGVPPPPGRMTFFADALTAEPPGAEPTTEAGAPPAPAPEPEPEAPPVAAAGLLPREEGGFAVPSEAAFALLPQSAFFEFVPESDMDADQPGTLLLHEIRRGGRYEVVVTTKSGLWRYRTGDVVRVVGLEQGGLPLVTLAYRDEDAVRLPGPAGERRVVTSEHLLAAARRCEGKWAAAGGKAARGIAVEEAALAQAGGGKGLTVLLDVSAPVPPSGPRTAGAGGAPLPSGASRDVDEALREVCPVYDEARREGAVPQAVAAATAPGAFARRWRQQLRDDGVRAALHKPQRLIRDEQAAAALLDRA